MKTIIKNLKNLVLILSVITIASCDEVDELTEVDFDTTITKEVVVNLSQTNASLSENVSINLADNNDIEPYLSKIESVTVTSASYVIKDYNGIETATGSITANANSEVFGPFQHTFFTDDQNATVYSFDASRLNALGNSLTSNNLLNINLNGTQNPPQNANFTIEFTMEVEVIAQAL